MKKKAIIVILILLILGTAVTIGLIFNRSQGKNTMPGETQKLNTDGAIPKLSVYYDKENIGEIDGYTMEMEEQSIRDTIIPIAPSRQAQLEIKVNGNKVKNVSYEVESTNDNRLIDSGDIGSLSENNGKIFCKYQASTIMNEGTEYILKINVTTDKYEHIYYYTRVMVTNEEFVTNQVKFAKDFSDTTFNSSQASKLAVYLEPDLNLANDNMGQITIKSNYSMLIWKNLQPKKKGSTKITAKEICIKDTGEAGTYTMNYQIKCTNAQKVEETYNVEETITVWTCQGKQYVLAYNREVNQVWEATKNNIGNSFIDLGIQSRSDIEHTESQNGKYISFEINGDVYVMDIVKKQINPIYKLDAQSSDLLYKTRAKAISVDDKGNADYMIYGYSLSEQHIGKNGISIMEYNNSTNTSVERAFIPCKVPAAVLGNQLSKLCYVGDGALYIMLDNTIYYVNLKTKEWGILVSDLAEGACVISEDGTTIAYNTSGGEYDEKSITVVDLTNGDKKIIESEAEKVITVCGYTGGNLVYGMGEKSQIAKYKFFPMNTLKIVDSQLKEIKSYEKKGIYITNVEITSTIINIKRWKGGKNIADDQLLDNTEAKAFVADSSYYNDEIKQKELALAFTDNLDASVDLILGKAGKVTFESGTEVNSKFEESSATEYFVYGYGKLQGVYQDKNEAIKEAKNVYGIVTDEKGQKIWIFEQNYN